MLPDFHGNRSPLADPHALGVISGLTLDASFDASAGSTGAPRSASRSALRHILDALNERGYVDRHAARHRRAHRNPLLMELYADATGCRSSSRARADAVLLGTAMVAAAAGGLHPGLAAAGAAMQQGGTVREPDPASAARYERDWRAFLAMQRHRAELEGIVR